MDKRRKQLSAERYIGFVHHRQRLVPALLLLRFLEIWIVSRQAKHKWIVTQFRVNGIAEIFLFNSSHALHHFQPKCAMLCAQPKHNNNGSILVPLVCRAPHKTARSIRVLACAPLSVVCLVVYEWLAGCVVPWHFSVVPLLYMRVSVTYQFPFSLERLCIVL